MKKIFKRIHKSYILAKQISPNSEVLRHLTQKSTGPNLNSVPFRHILIHFSLMSLSTCFDPIIENSW